jgi:hypothetical protein
MTSLRSARTLESERALSDFGHAHFGGEDLAHAFVPAETLGIGGGHHQPLEVSVLELLQMGLQIAARRHRPQILAIREHLSNAAPRSSPHALAAFELVEDAAVPCEQDIERMPPAAAPRPGPAHPGEPVARREDRATPHRSCPRSARDRSPT